VSLKQLLKNVWLYSWVLIVPLAILASFTDLLLLGGIRLFLSMITSSHWNFLPNVELLKNMTIPLWMVLMLAVIVVRYLTISLRLRSEERLGHQLESHLRSWWIGKVKKLHPSQFHKPETNSILHNANSSVSAMPKGCKLITSSIQAAAQLLFFVPILFLLSWQLTLILLFIFAPVVLFLQNSFKKSGQNIDDFNKYSGDYDSNLWQWVAQRKFWNNPKELSRYVSLLFEKIRNLKDISTKMSVKDVTIMQNIETLSIVIMCIVLAVCASLIKTGTMETLQIILFCAALFICYKPLKDCSQIFSNLNDLRIAYSGLTQLEYMERSVQFIEECEEDCIKIDNMSFRYGYSEPWVFQSLNNVIKLKRPLMLQGENGSGKTTLLRILSGLEIPQGGSIYMPSKTMANSFYFSQRLFLPPISWLEEEISKKNLSPTITRFFDVLNLDSLLKKHGHSNGEIQRLGLAWAVISGAPFLFLDEPFAFISQGLREPIFKAFWNATTETDQWWMMASHDSPPAAYRERIVYWNLV
jgi:ABC-type bacteriocin/lantibiotic exporter with double-glycine peptidase domain